MGSGLRNQLFWLLSLLLVCGSAEAAQRTDRMDLVDSTGAAPGRLDVYEDTSDGTNKTRIQTQAQAGDITYTLPPDDGDASEVLTTNGSGSLTWEAGGAGGGMTVGGAITSGTANRVLYESATNTLAESADFTFTGVTSSLAVTGTTTNIAKSSTVTPLVVQGAASQTVPVFQVQDSAFAVSTTIGANGSTVFNEAGNAAAFRVESDTNANMIYVDGANNRVGIGTGSPTGALDIAGGILATGKIRTNLNLDVEGGVVVDFISPNIQFGSSDFTGSTIVTGTNSHVNMSAAIGTVFNENSADLDFRVESDGDANAIFVDGGTNLVGIGTASPTVAKLHVVGTTSVLRVENTGTTSVLDTYSASANVIGFVAGSGDSVFIASNNTDTSKWWMDTAGNIGMGTITPQAAVDILDAGTQLRLGTSTSFYATTTVVTNSGSVTNNAVGNNPEYIFSDPISVTAPTGSSRAATFNGAASSTVDTVRINAGASQTGIPFAIRSSSGVELVRLGLTGSQAGADVVFAGTTGSTLEIRSTGSGVHAISGIDGSASFNTSNQAGDFIVDGDNLEAVLKVEASTDDVGIVTTAPDAALEINDAAGDNLRLTYNDNNGSATTYADFTLSSAGDLTIDPSGTQIITPNSLVIGTVQTSITSTGTILNNLGTTNRNVQSRIIPFQVTSSIAGATTTTGNNCAGDLSFQVQPYLNNFKVSTVVASVRTVSSSGTLTLNFKNMTTGNNILSTALTIDATERSSTTAATPAVINAANATISTNDDLCVQVSDAATGNFGLQASMEVIP